MKKWKKYLASTVLTMLFACAFIGIKTQAAPAKVTGLKQTGYSTSGVRVEWKAVTGNVAGYYVDICKDGKFQAGSTDRYEATSTFKEIFSREAGSSYYVRVTAVDSKGEEGTPSNSFEVVTAPSAKPTKFKQTKAEEKKITVAWTKAKGANAYHLWYAKTTSDKWNKPKNVGDVAKVTINASKDSKYDVWCFAARKSASGYMAINYGEERSNGTFSGAAMLSKPASTKPAQVKSLKFITSGSDTNASSGLVYFTWKKSGAADKYEYQVTSYDGKTKIIKSANVSYPSASKYARISSSKLKGKASRFMKIRVRAYASLSGNTKVKTYGKWSDWYYFTKAVDVTGKWVSTSQMQVSWKKVKGANNYTVYISAMPNSGYKKVKTTKGTSCNITKYGSNNLVYGYGYYIKVYANRKVGSKTYTSDKTWYIH